MADFEFIRVDSFLDDMNRPTAFDVNDMDGITKNYHFVLASSCPTAIDACIDSDGTLITRNGAVEIVPVYGANDGAVSLLWEKGVNGERSMAVSETSVTFDLSSDNNTIQAIFLVSGGLTVDTEGTGYVLAYAINNEGITVKNQLVLQCDGMVVNIKYGA